MQDPKQDVNVDKVLLTKTVAVLSVCESLQYDFSITFLPTENTGCDVFCWHNQKTDPRKWSDNLTFDDLNQDIKWLYLSNT